MKPWTSDINPRTIPDDVLKSERARRNALKRTSYTGGVVWGAHNAATKRCRCERCIAKREATREQALIKRVLDKLQKRRARVMEAK